VHKNRTRNYVRSFVHTQVIPAVNPPEIAVACGTHQMSVSGGESKCLRAAHSDILEQSSEELPIVVKVTTAKYMESIMVL